TMPPTLLAHRKGTLTAGSPGDQRLTVRGCTGEWPAVGRRRPDRATEFGMHEGDVRIGPEAGSEANGSKSVTEYGSRTQPPKPTRNRRRWTKITTIVLILVGLLVAADFGLAAFAEHSVSQQARSQFGLDSDPNVTVHGFPFTTQAISGEYDHIS